MGRARELCDRQLLLLRRNLMSPGVDARDDSKTAAVALTPYNARSETAEPVAPSRWGPSAVKLDG